jgi:hypothetical protein
MDNNLRQTLAQVLKEVNAPVEKLDKNTYVINGVIVKHVDDHWVLVSKFLPKTVITHSKIAVVLPWMLDKRNMKSWIAQDKILQLDKQYSWALFKVENQRRIMSRAIKNKQQDRALIMFDKLEQSKARLRSINSEISIAINGVKINK